MLPLLANTATIIFKAPDDASCVITVISDSTTCTRLSKDKRSLTDNANQGFILSAYRPLMVRMSAGEKLYGISTGTPNISVIMPHDDFKVI